MTPFVGMDDQARIYSLKSISESTKTNFLSVSGVTDKEEFLKQAKARQQRRNTTSDKQKRKSSILKSLAILDINENDDDYKPENNFENPQPRGRYLRRESVIKHHLEANSKGMQPIAHFSTGDKSDYGSDYDSGMEQEERRRRRYMRRGSVTKYSLDAAIAQSQETASKSAVRTLPPPPTNSFKSDRRSGSMKDETSCTTSSTHSTTSSSRSASSIDLNSRNLENTGRGHRTSGVPLPDDGMHSNVGGAYDSEMEQAERQRRRYMRRGSVTKYSLDSAIAQSQESGPKVAVRRPLPPPPSNSFSSDRRLDFLENETSYARRPLSDKHSTTKSYNPAPGDDLYSENLDDSGHGRRTCGVPLPKDGINSNLNDSGRVGRSIALLNSRNLENTGRGHRTSGVPLPDDGMHSNVGGAYDSEMEQAERQRRRYMRRGSVTKYSLDSAIAQSQESGPKVAVRRPLPPPPSNSFSSDRRLDFLENETSYARRPLSDKHSTTKSYNPAPGDDLYSENLDDSGHGRRTCGVPLPKDGINSNLNDSGRVGRSIALRGDDLYSENIDDSGHVSHLKSPRLLRKQKETLNSSKLKTSLSRAPLPKPQAIHKKHKKTSNRKSAKTKTRDLQGENSSPSEKDEVLEPSKHKHHDHKPNRVSSLTKAFEKMKNTATTVTATARSTFASSSASRYPPATTKNGCLKKEDGKPSAFPKKIRFGHLVITEFPIILGDNPAVTAGAPVTIDWTPQNESSFSITAYEQSKPERRRRRKLLISVSNRAILLLAAGYSIDEIANASINAQQIKFSRQESVQNQSWDRVNMFMENTNDALRGMVTTPGKKLKALIVKPMQHSETARTA